MANDFNEGDMIHALAMQRAYGGTEEDARSDLYRRILADYSTLTPEQVRSLYETLAKTIDLGSLDYAL